MDRTEIYTLGPCSPYPKDGCEKKLRRRTIDLRPVSSHCGKGKWCQLLKKNKNQQKSIIGGLLVYLGTSTHIIWGHWRLDVMSSWKYRPNLIILIFSLCAWYLGCVCGSILCAILIKTWTKKQLYYLSASVLSLSGVMFIIWHETLPALLGGRILAGACNGIVFLALLVHATENTVKELRGLIICSIGYLRAFTTFLATLLFIIPYYNPTPIVDPNNTSGTIHVTFDVDLLLGIVTFVYAIIALLSIPYLTCESVPLLIQQGRDRKALENLIKLRSEPTDTWAVRNEFDELRLMVVEDYQAPGVNHGNIFTDGNWRPLCIILAIRLITLLSSNLTFQLIAAMFVKVVLDENDHKLQYAIMILLGCRVGLGILPMMFCDKLGRKHFLLVSGCLCGTCLAVLGVVLYFEDKYNMDLMFWLPGAFFICFYVFASIGIDSIGNVFMAEAFPMAKKAWSITVAIAFEHILNCALLIWIVLVRFDYDWMLWFVFVSGVAILLLSLWLYCVLPETRGMSLRQCRNEFNKTKAQVAFTGKSRGFTQDGITYSYS